MSDFKDLCPGDVPGFEPMKASDTRCPVTQDSAPPQAGSVLSDRLIARREALRASLARRMAQALPPLPEKRCPRKRP